ncbi:MAG: magnesium transporter CorA family protein [Burkholderiales bacterium]|nr:magnesium transporter CorA family protein [Burkholderiales bacterium]
MEFVIVSPDAARAASEPPGKLPAHGFVWCDCVYEDGRAWVEPVQRLTGITVFDDHLSDSENPNHPSYFDSTSDYEMIVFRGRAAPADDVDPNDVIHVRTRPAVFFLLPGMLVTIRSPDNRQMAALRERLLAAVRSRNRLPELPEELMLRILNGMVDRYLDLRQPLSEQLERRQRELLDPRRPFRDWYALLQSRRETQRLQDLCEEQLDAIQEWRDERAERAEAAGSDKGLHRLSDALLVRTSDVVEHIHRVLSHARRLESSVESAVQLHFSSTAHRTNESMRTLTAITAVFMPLTLITGIFGMNFEFIPGLHAQHGFWWSLAVMAVIGGVLLIYLRTRAMISTAALVDRKGRVATRRRGSHKRSTGSDAQES